MYPPTVGPITELRPNTAPKMPCILTRCWTSKMSASTVKVLAKRMPPKPPCIARKAISSGMFWAKPQSQEPAMNPTMPTSMKGFRPNMSPSFPEIGTRTVDETR